MLGGMTLAAQQPPPAHVQLPPALPPPPLPQPGTPTDGPVQLMAIQQLSWIAYPELRTRALQLRVEQTQTGPTATFGFYERDRDAGDLLGLSRPREAQLVVEAGFDQQQTLKRALLRGPLARTAERRQAHGAATRIADRLDADGAKFGPAKRIAFLQQLDLAALRGVAGPLTMDRAQFETGATADGVYWSVTATSPAGPVTLGFEPYAGRLVRFAKGGGR